jgi:hypothetical protein
MMDSHFTLGATRTALAFLAVLALGGCASLPNGRQWGEDATYRPGWERVRRSALDAVRDPWVWGPLVGAGVLQIGHADQEISNWAREKTPVFGSERSADRWSDDLRTASMIAYHASALATPSGEEPGSWFENKAKGYLVGFSAASVTNFATQQLKTSVGRERPNGVDHESFPSGHTSASAVFTQLASRNLRSIETHGHTQQMLDIGLDALTIGTAWARIEAGAHFPSDTLFSMALGNLLASFFNDAFLGLADDPRVGVAVVASGDEVTLRYGMRF